MTNVLVSSVHTLGFRQIRGTPAKFHPEIFITCAITENTTKLSNYRLTIRLQFSDYMFHYDVQRASHSPANELRNGALKWSSQRHPHWWHEGWDVCSQSCITRRRLASDFRSQMSTHSCYTVSSFIVYIKQN